MNENTCIYKILAVSLHDIRQQQFLDESLATDEQLFNHDASL